MDSEAGRPILPVGGQEVIINLDGHTSQQTPQIGRTPFLRQQPAHSTPTAESQSAPAPPYFAMKIQASILNANSIISMELSTSQLLTTKSFHQPLLSLDHIVQRHGGREWL